MTYTKPLEPRFAEVPQGEPFRGGAQLLSPPWLLNYVGARYVFSGAVQWDTLAEYTRLGVIQRYPGVAQPDALGELGKDRKIFRGISETDEHYAERLRTFKRTWKFAGNAPTLLRQLWELLQSQAVRIRYVVNGYSGAPALGTQFADWWTIDGTGLTFERRSPSNWDWDGVYAYNPRFWIIIYRTDFVPAAWGVPPYAWGEPGLLWGGQPGDDNSWVIDVFNIVEAFKAAGSHMGPWPGLDGGLIVANPLDVSSPWDANGPFYPGHAPGYPMPDGDFNSMVNRPPGPYFLSGV